MDTSKRLQKARTLMAENKIDALYLFPCGDMQYLTGIAVSPPNQTHHHRSGDWLDGVLVTQTEAVYIVPWMIREFAREQAQDKPYITDVQVVDEGLDYLDYAGKILDRFNLQNATMAFPKLGLAKTVLNFQRAVPGLKCVCTEVFTCEMRMIKEPEEIEIMREASRITDNIFLDTVKKIKPGMMEIEVAQEIEYLAKLRGADYMSFPTDVMLEGPGVINSGGSGLNVIRHGCNLAFDFGLKYKGYASDFGRTIYIGEPSEKWKYVHHLVMDAQNAAIMRMKPGEITAVELDKVARDVIRDGGFTWEFFHRLGHAIGVDVHEYPYLNKGYDVPLQENMVFTVEPSVLVKGDMRIRVEDVVRVTPDGGEVFNQATHEMIVIE